LQKPFPHYCTINKIPEDLNETLEDLHEAPEDTHMKLRDITRSICSYNPSILCKKLSFL